ncbi:MAG: transposase [bacterium]|nr:transposase [bacterium]
MARMDANARHHRERGTVARGEGQRRYARHRPQDSVLYQIVERHAGAFFDAMTEQGASLPRFVRDEFDAYIDCGRIECGFVRAKCEACRYELLAPFSCRKRGFCPSCGVRRMVETAAHLVDHVLPRIPLRQWVVTFPWPLRLVFAARPDWLTRVLSVVTRALSSAIIRRAGLRRVDAAQTGVITFIQRAGSALNLNVHFHILAPDGAYTFEHAKPRFQRASPPSLTELRQLLDTLIVRTIGALVRGEVLIEEPEYPYLDLELVSPLDQLSAAAVRYRIAVGPQAGRKTMTLRTPEAVAVDGASSKPFTAARDGFSLNCAVACKAQERNKLERVIRYMARPPVSQEHLSVDGDGLVVYELKHTFSDGTTQVLFEPQDFIARLAALVPRPRAHLVRYHGVFAPNARHRHLIVPRRPSPASTGQSDSTSETPTAPMTWMARLNRGFGFDVETCPKCGGKLRVIGAITAPDVIARIVRHVEQRERHDRHPRAPPALLAS